MVDVVKKTKREKSIAMWLCIHSDGEEDGGKRRNDIMCHVSFVCGWLEMKYWNTTYKLSIPSMLRHISILLVYNVPKSVVTESAWAKTKNREMSIYPIC